jgi:hypothetical protein
MRFRALDQIELLSRTLIASYVFFVINGPDLAIEWTNAIVSSFHPTVPRTPAA